MLRNSYNRFFPTPSFLMPSSFGLDISDESIKLANLILVKGGIKIDKYGEKKIAPGIIESGKIKDIKRIKFYKYLIIAQPAFQIFESLFNFYFIHASIIINRGL